MVPAKMVSVFSDPGLLPICPRGSLPKPIGLQPGLRGRG